MQQFNNNKEWQKFRKISLLKLFLMNLNDISLIPYVVVGSFFSVVLILLMLYITY